MYKEDFIKFVFLFVATPNIGSKCLAAKSRIKASISIKNAFSQCVIFYVRTQ